MGRRKYRLPESVKLLGKTFRVLYVSEVDPDEHLQGSCEVGKSEIRVCRTLSKEAMRDTLVHEIVHAIYHYLMSDLESQGDEFEERVVLFTTLSIFEMVSALGRGFFEHDD